VFSARVRIALFAVVVLSLRLDAQPPPGLVSPGAFFGFQMGADRRLADAESIERYFATIAQRSDRVKLVDLGPTTEGHKTPAAIVSAPENIRNLEAIRAANQRLADPRTLPPDEAQRLIATQKVIVAIGCSIHATEIGATQAANELLYRLAAAADAETIDALRNTVVIVIPMLNPDGVRLVVDWYNRQLGSPFEGGPMPWGDHRYAGHDINRDAFMMNMVENRNLSRFFYTDWHPQVFLSMHQMEGDGPRFFAPPNDDPLPPNYDPVIWRAAGLFGSAMTLALERDHRQGVVSNALYDYYWPGYEDSAPLGHNTICLLTEAARVNVATPVVVPPAALHGGQKGLREYRPQINFPDPWPGGRWTLRDIVEYDLTAVNGLLRAAASYRHDLVESFYAMGRRAIVTGAAGDPFAFVIPREQHDLLAAAKLEDVLLAGGIDIERSLEPFLADGNPYPAGTDLVLLAQPYRAYVKTLLERQSYPGDHQLSGASADRPYDVTGWTLPSQMGVDVRTVERPFGVPAMSRVTSAVVPAGQVWGERKPDFYVIDARGDQGAVVANRVLGVTAKASWVTTSMNVNGYEYEAGAVALPRSKSTQQLVAGLAAQLGVRVDGVKGKLPPTRRPLSRVRVGLYKPWVENDDEGWTRWVLEQYEFPFASLSNADLRAGNLRARFDAIILPSAPADVLLAGQSSDITPAEYAGGLMGAALQALDAFVRAGGTLICLDQSGSLAIDTFQLPLRDIAHEAGDRFFCPGSIVRIDVDPTEPLAFGMAPRTAGFFSFSSAYEVIPPEPAGAGAASDPAAAGITTAARYAARDVLVSGWLEGESVIAGRAAAVQAAVGAGRVVLLGFPVQHRGQSLATFRLLFNAIFTSR
jgi:hypothetical protein